MGEDLICCGTVAAAQGQPLDGVPLFAILPVARNAKDFNIQEGSVALAGADPACPAFPGTSSCLLFPATPTSPVELSLLSSEE